ncbi:hypothetical protein SCYAM73S_04312 [Streptomyces cyaneofuscatus]
MPSVEYWPVWREGTARRISLSRWRCRARGAARVSATLPVAEETFPKSDAVTSPARWSPK